MAITDDFDDFVRVESGQVAVRRKPVDLEIATIVQANAVGIVEIHQSVRHVIESGPQDRRVG